MELLLDRPTTPQRAADVLREQILRGLLPAGTRCGEQTLAAALGISRNTLREAFQVLLGERLLVREPHRGVFVRRVGPADVRDIYTFRRLVECAALAEPVEPQQLTALQAAVQEGSAAAGRGAWPEVGTADVRFHRAVAALGGSSRLDRAVRGLFAELGLAFHLVPDPRALHAPFLPRNAEILALAEAGRCAEAASCLRAYLHDAEAALLALLERV